jgi:cupin 2 domain-containing protein
MGTNYFQPVERFQAVANLFAHLPEALNNEVFQTLLENGGVRIERIISQGQTTPAGEWYDQEQDEWVLLLSGVAELIFDGNGTPLLMKPGDYLMIPAHCRHRVAWTDPDGHTVWLAVHFPPPSGKS